MGKKKLYCAPDRDKNTKTCYTKEDLLFLVNSYNKKRPSNKNIPIHQSKEQLWKSLRERLKSECETEWCWLEQDFVPAPYSKKILNEVFRPEKPEEWKKNPFEWLTSIDIKKVMKQYEKKYPEFIFIGPVPVDCPSGITCALSGLDVDLLDKRLGKTKMGVIFNLDPHNKPGSHWVAVYADFIKGGIFYFDSVGMNPPIPIKRFLEKLKENINNTYHNNAEVFVNRTKFQFGNSECGVFSMHFIISNLEGKGLEELNKQNTNDEKMNQLRDIYYRPS